mgnify:CR=1 FL=1
MTQENREADRFLSEALRVRGGTSTPEEGEAAQPSAGRRTAALETLLSRMGADPQGVASSVLSPNPPVNPQEIEDKKHKSNWLSRYFLGGTKWGVIDTPGPNLLFNPLKTIWSGLEWTQENLASPITGLVVGGGTMLVDNTLGKMYNVRGKKWANQFRSSLSTRRGGLGGLWEAAGDYNEDRDSLYPGEKFIHAVAFDPTSYIGLGLLAKTPFVGRTAFHVVRGKGGVSKYVPQIARYEAVPKTGRFIRKGRGAKFVKKEGVELSLGALDTGFRQVTDWPFKQLFKVAKYIPKTRGQYGKVDGNRAAEITARALQSTGAGSFQIGQMDRFHVWKVLEQALDVTKYPKSKLSPEIRRFRELLFTEKVPTIETVNDFARKLESIRTKGGARWLDTDVRKIASDIEGMSDDEIKRFHDTDVNQMISDIISPESRHYPRDIEQAQIRLSGNLRTTDDILSANRLNLVDEGLQVRKTQVSYRRGESPLQGYGADAPSPTLESKLLDKNGNPLRGVVRARRLKKLTDEAMSPETFGRGAETTPQGILSQASFEGVHLSTTGVHPVVQLARATGQLGRYVSEVATTAKNPYVFRSKEAMESFTENFLPLISKERLLYTHLPRGSFLRRPSADWNMYRRVPEVRLSIKSADPAQIKEARRRATQSLKDQGYDSVYLPETSENAGVFVVFDQANIKTVSRKKITSKLVESELDATASLKGITGTGVRGTMRFPLEKFAADVDFDSLLMPKPKDRISALNALRKQLTLPSAEIATKYRRAFLNKGVEGLTTGERIHFGQMIEKITSGRESIERVSEELLTLFNANHSAKNMEIARDYLTRKFTDTGPGLQIELKNLEAKDLVQAMKRKAIDRRTDDFANADSIIGLYRQGFLGGTVERLDDMQLKWYQNGLRKFMIRPLNSTILMFPAFPIQNMLEDLMRQVIGRSSPGFASMRDMERTISLPWDGMPRHLVDDSAQVTRAAPNVDPHSFSYSELIASHTPEALERVPGGIKKIAKALNPTWYPRIGNTISVALRRHFWRKRASVRATEVLDELSPEVGEIIANAPTSWIGGKLLLKLQEDLALAALAGPEHVRAAALDYAADVVSPKELNKIVDDFLGDGAEFSEETIEQLHAWADNGGVVTRLENAAEFKNTTGLVPEPLPDNVRLALEAEDPEKLVEVLTGMRETPTGQPFQLPTELAESKVNYGLQNLQFESDLDRALYIASSGSESTHKPKFIKLLKNENVYGEDAYLKGVAAPLRKEVKRLVDAAGGSRVSGVVKVPKFERAATAAPTAPTGVADVAPFTLPRGDLAKARPRYRKTELLFESDLDKALYIATSSQTSTRKQDYIDLLRKEFGDEEDLFELAKPLKERIGNWVGGDQQVFLQDRGAKIRIPPTTPRKGGVWPHSQPKPSVRRLLDPRVNHQAVNQQLQGIARDVLEREWQNYRRGPEGTAVALDGIITAIQRAHPENVGQLKTLMGQLHVITATLGRQMDDIGNATMNKISADPTMAVVKKQKIFDESFEQLDRLLDTVDSKRASFVDTVRGKEREALRGHKENLTSFADHLNAELELLVEGWREDAIFRQNHFRGVTKVKRRTPSFWREYYSWRSNHWNANIKKRNQISTLFNDDQIKLSRLEDADLRIPTGGEIKGRDFNNAPLSLGDLGYIVGGQSENIGQAILSGTAFNTKEEFVEWVVQQAQKYNHSNVNPKHIGALYEQQLRHVGLTSDVMDGFAKKQLVIENLMTELKAVAKAPSYGRINAENVAHYIEDVAQTLENQPDTLRGEMKRRGQDVVNEANEDLRNAFVDYEDSNALDDFMQGIFPFWKYEMNRIPYLLKGSIQSPAMWGTIMPEGRYWDATDDGYVSAGALPWGEVNPLSGTVFNSTRRMFRAEYPPVHEDGVIGRYSVSEEFLGRIGFYPGAHISVLTEFGLGGEEKGDILTYPLAVGFNALESSNVPKISDNVKRMRNQIFPDRFRRFAVNRILAEWGYHPSEVDWEKFQPKKGAKGLTEKVLLDAVQRAAMQEFAQEATGLVRFRGDSLKKYQAAANEIYANYLFPGEPNALEIVKDMREQGINASDIRPIPQAISRLVSAIPNSSAMRAGSLVLRSSERRELAESTSEFYRQRKADYDDLQKVQQEDNQAWFNGTMTPGVWRETRQERRSTFARGFNESRGRRVDSQGEVYIWDHGSPFVDVPANYEDYRAIAAKFGDEIPIQHPLDALIEGYRQIAPRDTNNDGEPDWDLFYDDQEDFIEGLPDEFRQPFMLELDRTGTFIDKVERKVNREFIRDYYGIPDEVKAELSKESQQLIDDFEKMVRVGADEVDILRQDPVIKLWQRLSSDRKGLARLNNPKLDYALGVFGYISPVNFKSAVANGWWQADGLKPDLRRLD